MMKKIGKYTILLCIAIFGLHSICFIYNGLKRPTKYADIAIILGNKVNEDGTLSVRLQKRCDEGVNLYNDKLVNKLIVSGGLGKEGFYEGDKMRDYLISKGIPDSVIIVDNLGNNTEQSMKNLSTLQEKEKFERVIVVSQYYHITRAKQLLKKYGFKNIEGASPLYFEWRDIYSLPREIIAYDINLLK